MLALVSRGDVEFDERPDGSYIVYEKMRSADLRLKPYRTWLTDVGTTADGPKTVKELFDGRTVYDYPKPVALLKHLIFMGTNGDDDLVLDFFAGSCSTAQAVLEKNREDEGSRQFICVQVPEPSPLKSEARKAGAAQKDEEAYDLIMRDKERLLSFDQPVSFIFSHSALREGWDNPNVFQICTLNQTVSEMRKRQEVGRGMRLAVDQSGERVWDEHVNILTVVANESYDRYVSTLQQEIEADHGASGVPPRPTDARKRGFARLRKEYTMRPNFQELWQRISPKTRYAVRVDTESLIEWVVEDLDKAQIRPPQVIVAKARVEADDQDHLHAVRLTGDKGVLDLTKRHTLPNVISIMTHLLEFTTPPIRLSRRTLLEVFRRMANQQAALSNPQEFATIVVQVIKNRLADQLASGIQYEKV